VKSYSSSSFVVTGVTKASAALRHSPGVRLPAPGTRVALKHLLIHRRAGEGKVQELLDGVVAEAEAMCLLRHSPLHQGQHPNIQRYYGWFVCEQQTELLAAFLAATDPSFSPEATPQVEKQFLPLSVIVVEQFYPMLLRVDNEDGGSVLDDNGPFTARSFLHAVPNASAHLPSLVRDLKEALAFLGQKKIAHLSIKASNIAVIEDNSAELLVPEVAAAELQEAVERREERKYSASTRFCAVLINFRRSRCFSADEGLWERGPTKGPNALPAVLSEGDAAARIAVNRGTGYASTRVLPFRDADFYSVLRLEYSIMNRELSSKSAELRATQQQLTSAKQQLQELSEQLQATRVKFRLRNLEVDHLQAALLQCMAERDRYMTTWEAPESRHILSNVEVLNALVASMNNLKHPVVLHLAVDRSSESSYCVSVSAIDDEWLVMLVLQNNVFISTLDLAGCTKITDEGVQAVVRRNSKLRHVNLFGCHITDESVTMMSKHCAKLEFLGLQGFTITDVSIAAITLNPCAASLRCLELHSCHVSDGAMTALAAAVVNLNALHLQFISSVTDDFVLALVANCQQLTSVILAGSSKLTDCALKAVASLPGLKELDFSMCPQLTDIAVLSIGVRPRTAPSLLGSRSERTKEKPTTSSNAPNCPLEIVNFGGCRHLTDRSFFHLMAKCDSLRHLGLSSCKHLTASMRLLHESHGTFSKSDLAVSNDEVISMMFGDDFTSAWGKQFPPHLTSLDLSFCTKVTPDVICSLAQQLRGTLEELNIAGCPHVTEDTVEGVIRFCKNVRSINVSECDAIFDYTVSELRCRFPNITFISVVSH
jgi:serine/threonine protein kinase